MELSARDFHILHDACTALDSAGIPYIIGGGTAVAFWGRDRCSKDFDLFLNHDVLQQTMDVLTRQNFFTSDTEKQWLYKAIRDETLIDLIVETRGSVRIDAEVLARAAHMDCFGHSYRVMSAEDTVFFKALTLTEGRPDWHDAISIIIKRLEGFDWMYLLYRAQRHPRRLLSFLLFAQTELHTPNGLPRAANDNAIYPGDSPGPIPEWVIYFLVRLVWLHGDPSPRDPFVLESPSNEA